MNYFLYIGLCDVILFTDNFTEYWLAMEKCSPSIFNAGSFVN